MEEATAALSLTKVDVAKSSNQLELDQVRLGTALKQSFSPMECKPEKKDAHLNMWLPPPYHQMQWLKKKERRNIKFQILAERLIKLKWLITHEPDDADLQYDEFVISECSKHRKNCHI